MHARTRHLAAAAAGLLTLGVLSFGLVPPAAAQAVCPGYDLQHIVTKWGGPKAFSQRPVQSTAELQAYFAANEAEIRAALASQGLGRDVADALLAAVRQGTGITERTVPKGERLLWMAYREDGRPATLADVCVSTRQAAPAFEITVPVVAAAVGGPADCALDVSTDCDPDGTSTFTVRTAPGAEVTVTGPGGTRTVIQGGGATWTGPIEDPYRADYSFSVTNRASTTETVTTYTFVVPKECVNLSLVGRDEEQRSGPPATCSDSRTVTQPVCPVPVAECRVEVDATEVRRGDLVTYRVTGEWSELDLELLHDGVPVAEPLLSGPSGSFEAERRGTYTVVATVDNVVGDRADCRDSVEVMGREGAWIARAFGAYLMVDDGELGGAVTPGTCGCPADTAYGYDDGWGFGVSVERLFNERIGLELRGLLAELDDGFRIEANGVGIEDDDSVDYWDLTLGLNVHLTPNRAVDWYAGPFIGYAEVDGREYLVVDQALEYDAEGDFVWGVQTGLDWPFGDGPWALHLGARYTDYSVDTVHRYVDEEGVVIEQDGSIALDPITFELGLAYRF